MRLHIDIFDEYVVSLTRATNWLLLARDPFSGSIYRFEGTIDEVANELLRRHRAFKEMHARDFFSPLNNALRRISPYYEAQPQGTLLWCDKVGNYTFMALRKRPHGLTAYAVTARNGHWLRATFSVMFTPVYGTRPDGVTSAQARTLADGLYSRLRLFNGRPAPAPESSTVRSDVADQRRQDLTYRPASKLVDPARSWVRAKLGIAEGLLVRVDQRLELDDQNFNNRNLHSEGETNGGREEEA